MNPLKANIRAAARPQVDKRPAARKGLADNSPTAVAADSNREEGAGKPETR